MSECFKIRTEMSGMEGMIGTAESFQSIAMKKIVGVMRSWDGDQLCSAFMENVLQNFAFISHRNPSSFVDTWKICRGLTLLSG